MNSYMRLEKESFHTFNMQIMTVYTTLNHKPVRGFPLVFSNVYVLFPPARTSKVGSALITLFDYTVNLVFRLLYCSLKKHFVLISCAYTVYDQS